MRVDLMQKWEDIRPFVEPYPERMASLMEHVGGFRADFSAEALTVKELLTLIGGGIPETLRDKYGKGTVLEWLEFLNSARAGLENFTSFLEATVPPMTAEQKRAMAGILQGNIEESVLWTLKSVYNLTSLEQAHNLTVYEFKIARKNIYNEAKIAYNLHTSPARAGR